MKSFTYQELEDMTHALDTAARNVNIFSDTFRRYIVLEKKIKSELRQRREDESL